MKTLRLALAVALAAFIIDGTVANAETYYSRADANWSAQNTWSTVECGGDTAGVAQPGANDTAVICEGHTVDIDSTTGAVTVDTLVIEDSNTIDNHGTLNLEPDGSLEISRVLEMEYAHTHHGKITFSGTGGDDVGELKVGADIVAHGLIDVTSARGGTISRAADGDILTLAPEGRITAGTGDLTISAVILNHGTVRANAAHTITIQTNAPDPGSGGCWEVTADGGVLRFNVATTIEAASGHFKVTAGTLEIYQDVTFSGGYQQTGGTLDVAQGKTFTVTGRYFDCPFN